MLGQLCSTLWDSQSRPDVIQPGIEQGTLVMLLALRNSAFDHCPTQECLHVCHEENELNRKDRGREGDRAYILCIIYKLSKRERESERETDRQTERERRRIGLC